MWMICSQMHTNDAEEIKNLVWKNRKLLYEQCAIVRETKGNERSGRFGCRQCGEDRKEMGHMLDRRYKQVSNFVEQRPSCEAYSCSDGHELTLPFTRLESLFIASVHKISLLDSFRKQLNSIHTLLWPNRF
jgi:hypothetical protein